MTVDREQVRRAADVWNISDDDISLFAQFVRTVLALLAELEQAERERDEALERVRSRHGDVMKVECEAQLVVVPALVEAAKRGLTYAREWAGNYERTFTNKDVQQIEAAISRWVQAQGETPEEVNDGT